MLLLAGMGTSHALVRIANDRGGQIGRYVERYGQLRASGQTVMIDGLCASSCTIVLGAIPSEKICVTRNANLAFHAAWDFGAGGRAIPNPEATQMLYSMYPSQVRRWIANRGGLSPRLIFLRGRQLEAMYRPCYPDADCCARVNAWLLRGIDSGRLLGAGRVLGRQLVQHGKGQARRQPSAFLNDALWREGRRAKWSEKRTGMFQRTEGFKKAEADWTPSATLYVLPRFLFT